MYRNTGRSVAVAALCALGVAACSNSTTGEDQAGQSGREGEGGDCQSLTARASHHIGPNSAGHLGFERLAEDMNESTDGRVQIEVFPSGQLGGLVDNAEALRTGAMDLALVDSTSLSQFVGEIGAFDLPFMFESQEQFNDLLQGEVGTYVNKLISEQVGVIPLYWSSVGMRNIMLADGVDPVKSPEDLEGLTLRIPDAPVYNDTFKLLGATAVVVDSGELYTSVQTGVVDGFEFPWGTARDFSMQEVVGSVSETGHIHTNTLVAASGSFYDKLCESDRAALAEAAEAASQVTSDGWLKDNADAIAVFEQAGVELVQVDREAFISKVAPLHEDFKAEHGSKLIEAIQAG